MLSASLTPPYLDRTCCRVERQPGKRQTACKRSSGYLIGRLQVAHTHTHTSVANHSSPLNTIALSDADAETALAFVQQKLKEAKLDVQLTSKTTASVERLGGRASDLDSVRLPDLCVFVNCLNTHIC